MTYATEQFASTLKAARETRGLSQRALSTKSGVPQSHISKIENGAVDLRVSSLVKLARVLDLELMLVPRKAVSAVQSIVRGSADSALAAGETTRLSVNDLKRRQDSVASVTQLHPAVNELAQLQRQVRELQHFRIPRHELVSLSRTAETVNALKVTSEGLNALRASLSQLRNLRNALAHGLGSGGDEIESVRPAYSLDEDDHG